MKPQPLTKNAIPQGGEPSRYHGPPDPLLEKLTERGYSRHRSRLVDRWVAYGDAEGFFGEVAE